MRMGCVSCNAWLLAMFDSFEVSCSSLHQLQSSWPQNLIKCFCFKPCDKIALFSLNSNVYVFSPFLD